VVVLENCCDFDDSTHQLVDGLLADVKRRRQSMVSLWEGPSFMAEPKKILLVKPDSELTVVKRLRAFLHLEPLALEHLAGAVPAGDEVRILDMTVETWPLRALRRAVRRYRPDLVGVTAYSNQRARAAECVRIIREESPGSLIVLGGHHATIMPHDCRIPHLDALVRGEGCATFRKMIEELDGGRDAILALPNVYAPDATDFGEVPPYPGIDSLPLPRRDLVDGRKYFCAWSSPSKAAGASILPAVVSMRTSYGCAYECSFCIVPQLCGRKYFPRSIDSIVDELESLTCDYVYFVDDETFLSPRHMWELGRKIQERGIRKHYVSWARSNTVTANPDLFKFWHEIGLDIVYVGLESTSDATLKSLNKKATLAQNEEAIRILDGCGITLHPAFMVMPEFAAEDFQALNAYVQSMPPVEVAFTVYSPSPGTEDWKKHAGDYICDPIRFYDCMHTILPTRLPLKEFYRHFAQLTVRAMSRNPLRVNKTRVNPWELLKLVWMTGRYIRTQRNMWRDYA
jgi:radical SAM superfamily enzyme YgiQ (UPF0313 family)